MDFLSSYSPYSRATDRALHYIDCHDIVFPFISSVPTLNAPYLIDSSYL